jgi:hypothetical protein
MPFLSSASWYRVTFKPLSDSAWKALPLAPAIPFSVVNAMLSGSALVIYVIDSASGYFATIHDQGSHWDDSLLASATLLPGIVLTPSGGGVLEFTTDAGKLYRLSQEGIVMEFDGKQVAEFKAFVLNI